LGAGRHRVVDRVRRGEWGVVIPLPGGTVIADDGLNCLVLSAVAKRASGQTVVTCSVGERPMPTLMGTDKLSTSDVGCKKFSAYFHACDATFSGRLVASGSSYKLCDSEVEHDGATFTVATKTLSEL